MKIEITLKEDPRTQMPYWDGRMIQGEDNVVLHIVSKTFHPESEYHFEKQYDNVVYSIMENIKKQNDKHIIKHLLINN
jgi:hypothetical protein